tara:strand:+ start:2878 stop:3492 length:615 start_codon:yes stop_codon:yes gene_type:complete
MALQGLEIFPTRLFHADWEGDTKALLEYTKRSFTNEGTQVVDQSTPNLHLDPNYSELFGFVNQCLEELRQGYEFKCDGFKITTAWANKYNPHTSNQFHRHPMSAWSGVFFLTEGAPLAVRDPVVYRSHQSTMPISPHENSYFTLDPVPGRAVFFPHWVEHGAINDREEERWSIAFNSMPYGKVNFDDGRNLSSAILRVEDYIDE